MQRNLTHENNNNLIKLKLIGIEYMY